MNERTFDVRYARSVINEKWSGARSAKHGSECPENQDNIGHERDIIVVVLIEIHALRELRFVTI